MNREPEWESQIANTTLLEHFGLVRIDHSRNLD